MPRKRIEPEAQSNRTHSLGALYALADGRRGFDGEHVIRLAHD